MRRHLLFVFCHLKLGLPKKHPIFFGGGFSQFFWWCFCYPSSVHPTCFVKMLKDWSQVDKSRNGNAPCFYRLEKRWLEWCIKCPSWCWWMFSCFLLLGLRFTVYLIGWLFFGFSPTRPVTLRPVFTHHIKVWTNDSNSPTSKSSVMKLAFSPRKKGQNGKKTHNSHGISSSRWRLGRPEDLSTEVDHFHWILHLREGQIWAMRWAMRGHDDSTTNERVYDIHTTHPKWYHQYKGSSPWY